MPSAAPQLWLVINRPNTLPTALAAAEALADRFSGGCRLLLEDSSWWRPVRWDDFRARFTAVHTFPRILACRGVFDVPRLFREFAARQRLLSTLPFDPACDVLLVLAGVTQLGNAAAAAFRAGRRILCVPRLVHDSLLRPPDRWRYRFTTASWVQNRLIEPRLGLERTLHLKPRRNRGGDGVRLLRLVKTPEEVYDAVVVLSNTGRDRPPGVGERTVTARFPDLRGLSGDPRGSGGPEASGGGEVAWVGETDAPGQAVVFFGTPFLLVENLSPALYAERLNECLDFLRRSYPGRTWVYRPHPAETGEAALLRLDGFQVETDGEVAELYFLRHFRRIEAVFSVSSTVSRVALNSGLDAYCLWRCFPFAETQRRFFEDVMGTVPPEFDVRDLSGPPRPYAERRRSVRNMEDGPTLGEALRRVVEELNPTLRSAVQL